MPASRRSLLALSFSFTQCKTSPRKPCELVPLAVHLLLLAAVDTLKTRACPCAETWRGYPPLGLFIFRGATKTIGIFCDLQTFERKAFSLRTYPLDWARCVHGIRMGGALSHWLESATANRFPGALGQEALFTARR